MCPPKGSTGAGIVLQTTPDGRKGLVVCILTTAPTSHKLPPGKSRNNYYSLPYPGTMPSEGYNRDLLSIDFPTSSGRGALVMKEDCE